VGCLKVSGSRGKRVWLKGTVLHANIGRMSYEVIHATDSVTIQLAMAGKISILLGRGGRVELTTPIPSILYC